MAKKTSLVTGGSGFIGSHLVHQLMARGERVRILDVAEPAPSLDGAEYLKGSILDRDTVARALAGVHRVYHLAANPNLWSRRRREFEDVNVRGTEIVLEQAARVNVERIVHCSTESILKSHSHRLVAPLADAEPGLTIESVPGPYCRSKFVAEQRALEAAQRGLPVIVVNPTLPVGPGDRFLTPPTRMLVLFLNGGTPAYLRLRFQHDRRSQRRARSHPCGRARANRRALHPRRREPASGEASGHPGGAFRPSDAANPYSLLARPRLRRRRGVRGRPGHAPISDGSGERGPARADAVGVRFVQGRARTRGFPFTASAKRSPTQSPGWPTTVISREECAPRTWLSRNALGPSNSPTSA